MHMSSKSWADSRFRQLLGNNQCCMVCNILPRIHCTSGITSLMTPWSSLLAPNLIDQKLEFILCFIVDLLFLPRFVVEAAVYIGAFAERLASSGKHHCLPAMQLKKFAASAHTIAMACACKLADAGCCLFMHSCITHSLMQLHAGSTGCAPGAAYL